jgi:tetratricopeptide (TPR) repeat protein
MRPTWWILVSLAVAAMGCDIPKFTANSTSKVLVRAQPSLKSESDYEMASRALPASLKTVEGFWVVSPDNDNFLNILMEGYCQYGSGFVEDEVEQAEIRGDLEGANYHRARATKMFLRCLNYALKKLGPRWQNDLFGSDEQVEALLARAGKGHRMALMWAAVGLASAINNNKDRVEMIGYIDTAKKMLARVVEIDEKSGPPRDRVHAALPHLGLGMAYTALDRSLGGDPDRADQHFQKAIELTEGKFLLAKVLRARRVAFRNQNHPDPAIAQAARQTFHDELVKVLETPPSIWPEQRLANEIAHRRARRYLKQEKELFP